MAEPTRIAGELVSQLINSFLDLLFWTYQRADVLLTPQLTNSTKALGIL